MSDCNKAGNIRVNVASRHVRVTTVVVKKPLVSNSTIVCVCLCSCLGYSACKDSAMHYVACLAVAYFFTLSHKRHHFRETVIEYKVCVSKFSTFCLNISYSEKSLATYNRKIMYVVM
jgi:hypothetical protein